MRLAGCVDQVKLAKGVLPFFEFYIMIKFRNIPETQIYSKTCSTTRLRVHPASILTMLGDLFIITRKK